METNSDIRTQLVDILSYWQQPWEGTPEEFYVFVFMMFAATTPEVLEKDLSDLVNCVLRDELEAFAGGFMKIFSVNLSPYTSFGELIDDDDCKEKFAVAAMEYRQTFDELSILEEVTADGTIQLSPETQQESAINDLIVEVFMKRAQMFFRFKGQE